MALGLGAVWKSGRHLDGAPIRRLLAMGPDEQLMGWINLGHRARARGDPHARSRRHATSAPTRHGADARPAHRCPGAGEDGRRRTGRRHLRHALVPGWPGSGPAGVPRAGTSRAPCSSTSTPTLPTIAAPGQLGRHPLPDPVAFARRMGGAGHRPGYRRSSPMTTARASQLLVCGGCSTRWATDTSGCSTAVSLRGSPRASPSSRGRGREPTPETLSLATTWPRTIEREALRARMDEVTLLDVRAA